MAVDTSATEQKIFELKSEIDNHLTANLEQAQQNLAAAQASGNAAAISKAQGQIATVQTSITNAESQLSGAEAQLASAQAGGSTAVSPKQDPEVPKTNDTPINAADVNASATTTDPQAGAGEKPAVPTSDVKTSATPDDGSHGYIIQDETGQVSQLRKNEYGDLYDPGVAPEPVSPKVDPASTSTDPSAYVPGGAGSFSGALFSSTTDAASADAARAVVGAAQANDQETNTSLAQMPRNTDWRVTLRLAPGSTYLYNAADAGLLAPLKVTNGVIFPYTPQISTAYKANYSTYDLTHSNYRGYFYQNSYTDVITLTASFTAQSTSDAAYVLAVIHFFRSVTKMFYGQDAQRGSPPPLVFLSGLGDYQFNNHPCLVNNFNYTLPADVDYISSGSPNNLGLNLQPLQNLYSTTLNAVSPTVTRLASAFLPPGAENALPAPLQSLLNNPTYVPSKIDITLNLFPVQSRQQVSKQFSLKGFANGQLLKGGFW